MDDFSDILKSSKFISAYNKQRSGIAAGILWIENPSDRLFWELVVSLSYPDRYVVKPYSKSNVSGKRILEKEYINLHSNLIVGIDSDFDFICPERHENAKEMNRNPFVLHTFCYSRESLICCHESIYDILNKCYYQEKVSSEINMALNAYSLAIYDALCVFGYLHNMDWNKYKEKDFMLAITITDGSSLLDEKLCVNKIELDKIKEKSSSYVRDLLSDVVNNKEFEEFKEKLKSHGIVPETAYMFTNGHFIHDAVVKNMIKKIISSNRNADIETVKRLNIPQKNKNDRIREIHNHFKERCVVEGLMYNSQAFSGNIFFKKILNKLNNLNSV
ncbi:DUF4435 domain-containing protein [Xenorhabdus sp. PB62.4]|uniref:DUF4435 domain-containing protein n=1 Tax=Xenorhabdus sp. PB62.4 TaxID=1851573 RepID=UPI001656FF85|nr:hypothetical protein [Xenorhabdus sp. PB62.4]